MNLVSYIILIIVSIGLYFWIGFNIFNKYKTQNTKSSYFFIIYGIFFITLINLFCLLKFYSKIINKTGYPGEIGDIGEQGDRGNEGLCTINCNKNKCKDDLIHVINNKYQELSSTTKKIYKEIKSKELDKKKQQIEDNKKSLELKIEDLNLKKIPLNETINENKLYKTIYNDIIDNSFEDKIKKREYSKSDYASVLTIKKELDRIDRIIKDIKMEISELDNRYKNLDKNSIIEIKLINNMLNDIVINLCLSKQYQKAIETKSQNDINRHVSKFLEKMTELIYNNLVDKNDFFSSPYKNNTNTKFKKNPFELLKEYDLYYWGLERIFKPLQLKVSKSIEDNFLPTDHKPPLKFLKTNNTKWIYDDVKGVENPKISLYRQTDKINYRNEEYYPIGNLISNVENIKTSDQYTSKAYIKDDEKLNKKSKNNIYEVPLDLKTSDGINKIPKKETIMVTGDVDSPTDLIKIADNKSSKDRNDISIWRLQCRKGYAPISDYAILGYDKPDLKKINLKCLPEKCLIDNDDIDLEKNNFEGSFGKIYYSKDTTENEFNLKANNENSFNTFRHSKDYENNKLKKINSDCLKTTKSTMVNLTDKKLGMGWMGRPLRDPKYSIFSYLVQFPHGIIANKATNFKYYIIHTEVYNNRHTPTSNKFKTDAKNLYFVLTLNPKDNTYNRCLSVNKDELIRTKIKNEEQSYWVLEKINKDNYDEIRLISYKTYKKNNPNQYKYLYHDRRKDLRRDIVRQRVFEKIKLFKDVDDKELITFVNIKSTFGTNISTGFEETEYRKNSENNYYNNIDNDKNKQNNKHTQTIFKKRGITN